jgi:transcriptional regulator with XRE-family HTH domain
LNFQGNCTHDSTPRMKKPSGNGLKLLSNSEMPPKHKYVERLRKRTRNELPLTLGQLVQNYRETTGISLREFSKRVGISLSMVSLIERDRVYPRRPNLDKIAHLLEISRADIHKLDTRLRFDHLRRVVEQSPELREALRFMIEQVRNGSVAPEAFARALCGAGSKR